MPATFAGLTRMMMMSVMMVSSVWAVTKKGFGKDLRKTNPKAALRQELAANKQSWLSRAEGDLTEAHQIRYNAFLTSLKKDQPEVWEHIQAGDEAGRAALVEITWDTCATFADEKIDSAVEGNLDLIARTACAPRSGASVLDVGCGRGDLISFLKDNGADSARYVGVDVSGQMLERARAAHPSLRWERFALFADEAVGELEAAFAGQFDAVVFNGALQFFTSPEETLRRAAACLAPGGRLVVSHVRGGEFVREERRSQPHVVASTMPGLAELDDIKASLGAEWSLIKSAELGSATPLDAFYLVAFENNAST